MSLQLKFRSRARRDLTEILEYIAGRNGDYVIARQFGRRLLSKCEELTRAPRSGTPSSLGPYLRKINEGAYKIYYRVEDEKIVVLRIWDGRRGANPQV